MTDKIVLDSNFSSYSVDLEYLFGLLKSKRDGRQRKFTTIPIQDPTAARHFGFEPGQNNPEWQWVLYNDGTDKSNGSYADSNINDARITSTDGSGNTIVQTVQEQIIWIQQYIMDNTSDPRWKLFGGRFSDYNGDGTDEGTNVVVKQPQINQASNRPTTAQGTIRMKLGVTI